MSTVAVRFFAAARESVGASELNRPPGALSSILDGVEADHPAFRGVRARCTFLIDGVTAHDLGDEVRAGATVDVLPPFAGG